MSVLGYFGDIKRGIVTQEEIIFKDVQVDSSFGSPFETISYGRFKSTLTFAKNLGFDKFLDIGCGLGRSLVVANEVGFVDIYGVDISNDLVQKCRDNMTKLGISSSLSCSDVANFEIPSGKLAIFLFDPFGEERMRDLVKKLSLREQETLVIYHNPKYIECFKEQSIIKTNIWNHFGLYEEKNFIYLIPAKL
tara:strand:- start:734 stop:1309 length:576 start_codon:yes stop_codon:yes gene_type:complete